jgi:geranylgeranyl pyrophosphate synthase
VRRTRSLERARSVAEEYARKSQAALESLPESSYKETLAALAYYVIDRNR